MMQVGCCSACFTDYCSLPEAVRRIAALGFEAVELNVSGDGAFPGEMSPELLRELLTALGRSGLPLNLHVDLTYLYRRSLSGKNDFFELFRRLVNPLFEWGNILPLRMITFDGVYAPDRRSAFSGLARRLARPLWRGRRRLAPLFRETDTLRALQYAMARARSCGILTGLENYVEGTARGEDFDRIGAQVAGTFGVLFDVGHAHVTATRGGVPGGTAAGVAAGMALPVIDVHVSDNDGSSDRHLLPGAGTIDFRPVFAVLARKGYSGPVMLEAKPRSSDGPDRAIAAARDFLRDAVRSAG